MEKIEQNLIFMSVAAFDTLTRQERDFLCARFSDPLMMRFIDEQEKAARNQLTALDPDEFDESSDDFRQRVRNARLIWRFWNDFREFTQQFAQRAQQS